MKYTSARSFRQALEDRLRTKYPSHQIPRLRKMIAFERFMARLDNHWILKGGYALQLRTEKARTTQDIDLLAQHISEGEIREKLVEALLQDKGDYFEFFVERSSDQHPDLGSAIRFQVTSRLAGRVFERFHIDVGYGDPIFEAVEYLSPPNYLEFAEIETPSIPCYPVTQHIAEKLHALTRPRPVENSRVKDFVDILLFAEISKGLEAKQLKSAIQAVFEARNDILPTQLNKTPSNWKAKYNQLAKNLDLPFLNFDDAVQAAQNFINPVLDERCKLTWNPEIWEWKK